MGDKIDTVFVELPPHHVSRAPVLEWMLDHFDSDKTKIVLIPYTEDDIADKFLDAANSCYLPRCAEKRFRVEILIPDAAATPYGYDAAESFNSKIDELINKHGMTNFIAPAAKWTMRETSKIFDNTPNLCCKIWFVNDEDGKLVSTRCYGPCNAEMITEALVENEKLKKMVQEETSRCEKVEKELLAMSKQAKINEQEIDHLRQEIDQLKQNKEQEIDNLRQDIDQLKRNKAISTTNFTLEDLKQATQNFSISLKIGEGEYACVYKGSLNGTTVAIKKFKSQSKLSLSVLKQEIGILSSVRHPNLVTLIGACSEPPSLVSEFLPRGSLDNYLNHAHKTGPLPWQIRTRIIGEVCLALIFLHSNKPSPIVHGDLRPDNILLDADFTCKLSNFGLIKKATRTLAYMDPEYLTTEKMTSESDVYSFGVLVLHLLTRKCRLNSSKHVKETMVNDMLFTIIDESAGKWPLHHAEEVAKIGIWCADAQRSKRPDLINEVWPIVERLTKFPNEIMYDRRVYL
ncbi:hypothetical protein LUZ60_012123 [Juncus effusus]|nr:hypothetical protein LUZ60_012123 [Juncus effusus]